MEWMRNGATVFLRPFQDDPSIACPVRFYRVPSTNPVFSLPTIFSFDQWQLRDHIDVAFPGFEKTYKYNQGRAGKTADGSHFCGTPDQWLNGPKTTDPLPLTDPATGLPVCCGGKVLLLAGGDGQGGAPTFASLLQFTGGEGQGGTSNATMFSLVSGGQAEGGTVLFLATMALTGGQGEGGSAPSGNRLLFTGGQAEGGYSRKPGIALVQSHSFANPIGTMFTTLNVVMSSTVAANTLVLFVECEGAVAPITITDNKGSSWVQIGSAVVNADGYQLSAWYAKSIVSGIITVTVHGSAAGGMSASCVEYRGVDAVEPLDSFASNAQSGPTGIVVTTTAVPVSEYLECVVGAFGAYKPASTIISGGAQNRLASITSVTNVLGLTVDDNRQCAAALALTWTVTWGSGGDLHANSFGVSLESGS